jgi:FAD synthase
MKFDGLDALKAQITKDAELARSFFDFVIPTKVGI